MPSFNNLFKSIERGFEMDLETPLKALYDLFHRHHFPCWDSIRLLFAKI